MIEHQALRPPPLPVTMTSEERLLRLELSLHHERLTTLAESRRLESRIEYLNRELLRMRHASPLGWEGWAKIGLAILFPFLVWLFTGSLEKAELASRMVP
jgi:hypothetical protein